MNRNHDWLLRLAIQRYPQRPLLGHADLPPSEAEAWQLVANLAGVTTGELAQAVAEASGLKLAYRGRPERGMAQMLPPAVSHKYGAVPIAVEEGRLVVALSDPTQPQVMTDLRFAAGGRQIEMRVAAPEDVEAARLMLYAEQEAAAGPAFTRLLDLDDEGVELMMSGDDKLVRFCRALIKRAILQRASDIHLHPFAGGGVVRYRIDGQLVRAASTTRTVLEAAIRLLKAQGGMDSTNTLVPQDGRASLVFNGKAYDLRVSTLPASGSEALVMRILDQSRTFSLEKTNFAPWALHSLRRLSSSANGLVLITGPTGSGKTSTLYSLLATLNKSTRRIITVEEPVEYRLEGLTQVDVNPAAGLTFQKALRSVLRQDPDILLVGEIRDAETAEIAVQAALTGHLVFSTLHTQDAVRAIPRLVELGVSPPMLADTLLGVVSQRLLRQLCPHCKVPCSEPLRPIESLFERVTGARPGGRKAGCAKCSYSGYLGRFPVVETLELPEALRSVLLGGRADAETLAAAMPRHWHSIEHNAANWVISGITTPDEAYDSLGLRLWSQLSREFGVEASASAATLQQTGGEAGPAAASILVITSDEALRATLQDAAARLGHQCLAVTGAEGASEALLREHQLQLLIVDISAPDPARRAYAEQLRTSLAWAGLPVLALYDASEPGIVQRIEQFGIVAHLPSPPDPQELERLVGRLLS